MIKPKKRSYLETFKSRKEAEKVEKVKKKPSSECLFPKIASAGSANEGRVFVADKSFLFDDNVAPKNTNKEQELSRSASKTTSLRSLMSNATSRNYDFPSSTSNSLPNTPMRTTPRKLAPLFVSTAENDDSIESSSSETNRTTSRSSRVSLRQNYVNSFFADEDNDGNAFQTNMKSEYQQSVGEKTKIDNELFFKESYNKTEPKQRERKQSYHDEIIEFQKEEKRINQSDKEVLQEKLILMQQNQLLEMQKQIEMLKLQQMVLPNTESETFQQTRSTEDSEMNNKNVLSQNDKKESGKEGKESPKEKEEKGKNEEEEKVEKVEKEEEKTKEEKKSKRKKIAYQPYTIEDYRILKEQIATNTHTNQLLGPDFDSEQYKERKEKLEKQKEYAKQLRKQQEALLKTKKPKKVDSQDVQQKKDTPKNKAKEYAANIPKPKKVTKPKQTQPSKKQTQEKQSDTVDELLRLHDEQVRTVEKIRKGLRE